MNAFINYLLEANLGLCFFLLLYWIFLRNETAFSTKRIFLLASIMASLIFPLFHFTTSTPLVPAIGNVVPTLWPSDVAFATESPTISEHPKFDVWLLIRIIYASGLIIALSIFSIRFWFLSKLIWSTPSYRMDKLTILETTRKDHISFSFFNYIFIGTSETLSVNEKQLIVEHESIHAQQLHSLDVLVISIVGIFFWFNPVVRIFKTIFIQLHEYEADARSVKSYNVNDYCSLLAKVALLSSDIKLANHFSNSLILKRIEMVRKIRSKIKWWKIAFIASAVPLFFLAVSCNEQLTNDAKGLSSNANVTLYAPQAIVERLEAVKKKNPNSNYILIEFNGKADKLLAEMEQAHGIPASIELFTPDNGFYKNSVMNTEPEKISFNQSQEWEAAAGLRTFAIIEYTSMVSQAAERSKGSQDVYMAVEQTALPSNGLAAFYEHAGRRIKYPGEARKLGIQGKVFVEFVIETDGSISHVQAIKGIGGGCDEAAVDAVESSTAKWIPGKSAGVAVRQVIVLPITFKLAGAEKSLGDETELPKNTINEIVVVAYKEN